MPRQDLRRREITLAIATLAAVAACSDSAQPTAPPIAVAPAPQPPATTRDGNWAGFTAEGNLIKFTIDGGLIENLSFVINLTGGCDITAYQAQVNSAADAFVIPIRLGDGSDNMLSITAQFSDDNTSVAGSASLNYVGTLADGTACNSTGATTWAAMRNW
jgi:hypothetical protein